MKKYLNRQNTIKILVILILLTIGSIFIYLLQDYLDKYLVYSILMYYMYDIYLLNNLANRNIKSDIDILINLILNNEQKNSQIREEFKLNVKSKTHIWDKFKLKIEYMYNTEIHKWIVRKNTLRWIFGKRNN